MADLIYLAVVFLILALVFFILGMKGITRFHYGNRKMARNNLRYRCRSNVHIWGILVGIKLQE